MIKSRLLLDNRINLQAAISKNYSLEECAKILHKSRSTIYREIINNCYYKKCRETCAHCSKACRNKPAFIHGCCPEFKAYKCPRWKKFPYTCNGCNESQFCSDLKRYYDCIEANEKSIRNRKESRTYSLISNEDMMAMDKELINGIRNNGQSLHHLYVSSDILQSICSERTIRRYIYKGYMTVKAHELPRYVRYSHKYEYDKKKIVNIERMLGRTHSDYLNYVKEHPDYHAWQYDSVEGKTDDKKAVLTITLPETRFQFGYLIGKGNATTVLRKIKKLQDSLKDRYQTMFPINLADNGIEFTRFHEIEFGLTIKTFFTNPYKSTDKASCERNHEFIRYLIPKHHSLDFLTQEKVNLMFSHINSYVRASNKKKTPYELTLNLFGQEFMNVIGIKAIPIKDVCLKPSLIREKK